MTAAIPLGCVYVPLLLRYNRPTHSTMPPCSASLLHYECSQRIRTYSSCMGSANGASESYANLDSYAYWNERPFSISRVRRFLAPWRHGANNSPDLHAVASFVALIYENIVMLPEWDGPSIRVWLFLTSALHSEVRNQWTIYAIVPSNQFHP